ncbi:MAG: hypothetical protein ACREVW_01005 [Burkholderiales bacterium]
MQTHPNPTETAIPANKPKYILRFVEWQCGHHCQRPADIPVETPEQASLILQAISHAISQPGHARAVLMNDTHAEFAYLTDDYVAVGHTDKSEFQDSFRWCYRPIVVHGDTAQIEEIHSPALAEAIESLYVAIERWDGKAEVSANEIVTTTLGSAEIETIAAPLDPYEEGRMLVFDVPPVLKAAADLLAELREEAAGLAEVDEA